MISNFFGWAKICKERKLAYRSVGQFLLLVKFFWELRSVGFFDIFRLQICRLIFFTKQILLTEICKVIFAYRPVGKKNVSNNFWWLRSVRKKLLTDL